ncbi:MAG: winged helix-turn-helix transcriptional regulator [Bacteroidetes bacterium]|nr:winged helix-turn-helix transcriptional regulator [Bacteroidota bacterium]
MKIPYSEDQVKLARFAKAMGHPARIKILEILSNQECCYSGNIAEEFPIALSTLSQHLKELKKSGLIQGEINPPRIKYCINEDNWKVAKKLFDAFLVDKLNQSEDCTS